MSLGGGGGGTDWAGIQARQAEEQRQGRIRAGRDQVDQALSGFDDTYFDKYKTDYTNAYRPQIDQQYADTRKNLLLALSRSGNQSSSYGAGKLAELDAARLGRQNELGDQATQAVSDRRNAIEGARSDLYDLATVSADPGAASSAAATRRAALDTPVAASPLGDLFSSFTNMASTAAAAEQAGYYGTGLGLFRQNQRQQGPQDVSYMGGR